MAEKSLHPAIASLCNSLNLVADAIQTGFGNNNNAMVETWGWNLPSVNRDGLMRAATNLAEALQERAPDELDPEQIQLVKEWQANIDKLRSKTLQYLWNGNGAQASSAYFATIFQLREDLEPFIGWQGVRDSNLLPPKLARRLRSYQTQLDEISPDKDELARKINLINEATEAAESLPTDMVALNAARAEIKKLQDDALLMHEKIKEHQSAAVLDANMTKDFKNDVEKIVSQCEEAYRITTTKGLAGAFHQRAFWLNVSMWGWVAGLTIALAVGYTLGKDRLAELSKLLVESEQLKVPVWPTVLFAVISLGGPIWLAWIATKQIGQRFRLAEDYGFKATVAKAYEGYRKEAARIDKALESRLFSSALSRLEEAPLRLVEESTPGSPWHEFMDSAVVQRAIEVVPGFGERVKELGKALGEKKVKDNIADSSEISKQS